MTPTMTTNFTAGDAVAARCSTFTAPAGTAPRRHAAGLAARDLPARWPGTVSGPLSGPRFRGEPHHPFRAYSARACAGAACAVAWRPGRRGPPGPAEMPPTVPARTDAGGRGGQGERGRDPAAVAGADGVPVR